MAEFLTEIQKQNLVFFNENLDKWASDPLLKMKFAVISGNELKSIFDTFELALGDALLKFPTGEFIIQQIITKDETISFFSPALALV
jgi:hypothetical protein